MVTALWAAATQGPFYVGENSDPEYVYALNALNIIALRSPVHVDHPGTPLQTLLAGAFVLRHAVSCITGDCRSVIEEVVSDPERYLNFGRLILLGILAGTLFHAGRRAYAISGFLSAAVALQGVLFLFPAVVMSLARVTPEPMLMICSILFVLPFFELAFTKASKGEIDPADANRWAIVAGIAFAAGVASKITFLPLGALVFLFPSWRNWLRLSGAVAVAGFVLLLPISSRLQYFGTWVTSLLTHKGMYGGGEAGMPGGAQLLVSAKSLLVQETFLPVWVLALLIFSIQLRKIRTPSALMES